MEQKNKKNNSEIYFCIGLCLAMAFLCCMAQYSIMNDYIKVSNGVRTVVLIFTILSSFLAVFFYKRLLMPTEKTLEPIDVGETHSNSTPEMLGPGREYYRGLVVGFCQAIGGPRLYVDDKENNVKNRNPTELLESYKEEIKSNIVIQSLQFCVDRFNRKQDNGNPNDFNQGGKTWKSCCKHCWL